MQNGKRVRGGGVQSQNMKIYMDNIQYLKKTTITYVSTKCENTIVNFDRGKLSTFEFRCLFYQKN